MHIPYHGRLGSDGTPPSSGKLTDFLRPPFLGNFFPLDPLSREHYGDPSSIPLIFFPFLQDREINMCTYILPQPSAALPQIYNTGWPRKNATPTITNFKEIRE